MENTEPQTSSENQLTSDLSDTIKAQEKDESFSEETVTNSEITEESEATNNENLEIAKEQIRTIPKTTSESDGVGKSRSPGKDRGL